MLEQTALSEGIIWSRERSAAVSLVPSAPNGHRISHPSQFRSDQRLLYGLGAWGQAVELFRSGNGYHRYRAQRGVRLCMRLRRSRGNVRSAAETRPFAAFEPESIRLRCQ